MTTHIDHHHVSYVEESFFTTTLGILIHA